MNKTRINILIYLSMTIAFPAVAQDDGEKKVHVNGYMQLQTGVFVPLSLDGMFDRNRFFQDHKNRNYIGRDVGGEVTIDYDKPCNPADIMQKPCYPVDHGGKAGEASMARATVELEIDWAPLENINVHGIIQGVRALALSQDYWASPPTFIEPDSRADWVTENIYNKLDLREFYVDFYPNDYLSLRIGRQQVTWGQTGQYRLLDVINPTDNTWHFGPVEQFRDTRIPLWIAKALIDFPAIEHNLELVWVPGIDRPEDSVTVPLTMVGAWGVPFSNYPSSFEWRERKFLYPSQKMPDSMRGGLRWAGNLGSHASYSLVYYYTHQLSPGIPTHLDLAPEYGPSGEPTGEFDSSTAEAVYIEFPRQHIIGASFDYVFEQPISAVLQVEASLEPDRTFSRMTGDIGEIDDSWGVYGQRYILEPIEKLTINYAVRLVKPAMIRWLNKTSRVQFVVQWMQEIIPDITTEEQKFFTAIPGYSYEIEKQSWRLVGAMYTSYFHGTFTPGVVVAYVHPESGFVNAYAKFKLGDYWRIELSLLDFFGSDPYFKTGLFRDRDEINLKVRFQF